MRFYIVIWAPYKQADSRKVVWCRGSCANVSFQLQEDTRGAQLLKIFHTSEEKQAIHGDEVIEII